MNQIKVKIVEPFKFIHGVIRENMRNPPQGIKYSHFSHNFQNDIISIPLITNQKNKDYDLIEAFDTSIISDQDWIFNGCNYILTSAFNLFGHYLPRNERLKITEKIFEKDNCKKLIFTNKAGYNTMFTYGKLKNKKIISKSEIVYFAIRKMDDKYVKFNDSGKINLLFVGANFLRKGGKQLLDAFEILNKKYDVQLNIISRFAKHSEFTNPQYAEKQKQRALKMKNVRILTPTDKEKFEIHFPNNDIFVFPTLWETFGYAPVEAMAFGLPVISTDFIAALPEIVEDNKSGFLIKIMQYDFIKQAHANTNKYRNKQGIYIPPKKFDIYLRDQLIKKISVLIEDSKLRKKMGLAGLKIARTKFSYETRNKKLKRIYEEAVK